MFNTWQKDHIVSKENQKSVEDSLASISIVTQSCTGDETVATYSTSNIAVHQS